MNPGGINQAQRRIVTAGVTDHQQTLSLSRLKIKNVGAGLLANAVGQLHMYRLTPCIREQARSHICSVVFRRVTSLPLMDSQHVFHFIQQCYRAIHQLPQQRLILIHIPFVLRQVSALMTQR